MSINNIENGDSASGIREKLNELISIVNHYSSSAFMGGGDAGDGGGDAGDGGAGDGGAGGGSTYDSISLYSSGVATLNAESTSTAACGTIASGYPNNAYISKDPTNMGGSSVAEVNDTLYSDDAGTTQLSDGHYGYYDMMAMTNKSIQVYLGQISSIDTCA